MNKISVKRASVAVVDGSKPAKDPGGWPSPGAFFKTTRKMNEPVNITMTKRGSPHVIEIFTDPDDSHFCNVILRKAKTGQLVTSHYILDSDVPQWQRQFETDGFTVNNNDLQ